MSRLVRLLALVVVLCACGSGATESFVGRVVGVTDGDTVKVLRTVDGRKEEVRVRLWGIDAPEKAQAYGQKAKRFTDGLVYRKEVTVVVKDTDRYGRTVAQVYLESEGSSPRVYVNLEIVRAGFAWWYEYHAPAAKDLEDAHEEAKKAKRGLWADPNPVAPWDFRREAARALQR